MVHLQQMNFENIVAKVDIAHNVFNQLQRRFDIFGKVLSILVQACQNSKCVTVYFINARL